MDDSESSNLKETLEAIDAAIATSNAAIKRGEKLKRLMKNPDFIDVILEGYIEVEAKKLFKILTDPTGASPLSDEEIHLGLGAISRFKGYVGTDNYEGTVEIDANRAPDEILREETYRKQVTANYAANGDN